MFLEIIIFLLIISVQNIAVYLDNYAIFNLISNSNSLKIAILYINKNKIDFLSRGFLFFTPPILGYIVLNFNFTYLISVFLVSVFISLIISLIQTYNFFKKFNLSFSKIFKYKSIPLFYLSLLIFSMYLYVPFILNIIAYYYYNYALIIVQMNPAITVISSIYIVYYLDPKIARYIDNKNSNDLDFIYEICFARVLGRFLLLFLLILLLLAQI